MKTAQTWNDDRVGRLRKHWDDGLSASAIGRRLGVSRNAVLGKVHRLGLPRRAMGSPAIKFGRPRKNAYADPVRVKTAEPCLAPAPFIAEPARSSELVTLPHLRPNGCRWIIGDVIPRSYETLYCGAERIAGGAYCACHARRASHGRIDLSEAA